MNWIDQIPGQDKGFGTMTEAAEAALDYVNEQLSFRGTLQVENIDIEELDQAARKVLLDAAHIQAFRGAVYAALARASADGFETALAVTLRLFSDDWAQMHPTAPKAARLKTSAAKDIYEMVAKAAQTLPGQAFDLTETHSQLAKELREKFDQVGGFDPSPFDLTVVAAQNTGNDLDASSPQAANQTFLDARGRVELRQDILKLAERIAGFEPDAGIAASLRGYAAWMEHRNPPDHDENGQTSLANLPRKLRDDLLSGVQNPSYAALAKLEDRLVHSPDWFEGQMAASRVAKDLGLERLAGSIAERVRQRLADLPVLNELTYQNNEPFVPKEVGAWLGESAPRDVIETDTVDLEDPTAEAEVLSLEEVLERLNKDLANASSPRQRAILRLGVAKHLMARGQNDVAASLVDGVVGQTETLSVPEWDGPLTEQIRAVLRTDEV